MTISNDSKNMIQASVAKSSENQRVMNNGTTGIDVAVVQKLKENLKTCTVLTPGSDGYQESIVRWSDAVEKKAGAVVYVESAEDVSTCVLICREHFIDFVVCGGKHSSSGASSTEGGLVIDLGKMRGVQVDPEAKTLRVQGGCIWEDVDEAAGKYGLAMVGGTVNHTGVGGLTLGGGYGWLSGRHGLTIDCLLEVEIILGDGSIKTVSETENPDLFWAVRGAGHSFGVVTEFKFQAHDQKNDIWAGQIVFDPTENLVPIIEFANHLAEVTDGDSAMAMALATPPFMESPAIITTLFFNGPQEAAEALFQPLLVLNAAKKMVGMRPYSTMNSILNPFVGYGGRKCTKGASAITPLNPNFVQNLLLDIALFHKRLPGVRRTMINIEIFNPEKWCEVLRSATSYCNRGRYQNVVIGPFWEDPQYDMTCRLWARSIAQKFRLEIDWRRKFFGDANSTQEILEYGNYDGLGASAHAIFGSNYERLVTLKAKYDPDDVFNKDYAFSASQKGSKSKQHLSNGADHPVTNGTGALSKSAIDPATVLEQGKADASAQGLHSLQANQGEEASEQAMDQMSVHPGRRVEV